MPLQPGFMLNKRYRIIQLLGQGGFGAVYRALDTTFDISCAVKENLDNAPESIRQFEREARMLRSLRHPNLVQVLDYFSIPGGRQYMVMDYVEGQDLQERLDLFDKPFSEDQVVEWISQICDALHYLHSQQPAIIHRDINPSNIKITPGGQAILVDFGIAKAFDPNRQTTKGARAVTSGYSPPEQYGRGKTDVRSDVYALGTTTYTLLTGEIPADSVDLLTGNAAVPAPVYTIYPSISKQLSAAIEKAMNLETSQRYQNVLEFKQDMISVDAPKSSNRITQHLHTITSRIHWGKHIQNLLILIGIAAAVIVIILSSVYLVQITAKGTKLNPGILPDSTDEAPSLAASPKYPPITVSPSRRHSSLPVYNLIVGTSR